MSQLNSKIFLLFIVALSVGCSIIKPATKPLIITNDDISISIDSLSQATIEKEWLNQFVKTNDKRPVVLIAPIKNHSNTDIDLKFVHEKILYNLLASGKVRVLNNEYN